MYDFYHSLLVQAITFEEIESKYGPGVRRIVEGETKFSKIGNIDGGCSKADLKALDLQQLFLAMTEEVRIIVVKLADRLHNMRTLGSMAPDKQKKIASETLKVSISACTDLAISHLHDLPHLHAASMDVEPRKEI